MIRYEHLFYPSHNRAYKELLRLMRSGNVNNYMRRLQVTGCASQSSFSERDHIGDKYWQVTSAYHFLSSFFTSALKSCLPSRAPAAA